MSTHKFFILYLSDLCRHVYSPQTDEGCVAAVEEGAVEHLQDEGEVLKRQVRCGGAH